MLFYVNYSLYFSKTAGETPMANFINEAYYLEAKLKQCKANNVKDANGNDFTEETLRQAITDAGMTVESHYRLFGRDEGLQPNEYFNENEYLLSKINQLNTTGDKQWTLSELNEAISSIGLIPAEHYEQFGCMEKDGNGHYINPSNDFDTDAYYTKKLEQLQVADESWQNKSIDDVANAIHNANMSPISLTTKVLARPKPKPAALVLSKKYLTTGKFSPAMMTTITEVAIPSRPMLLPASPAMRTHWLAWIRMSMTCTSLVPRALSAMTLPCIGPARQRASIKYTLPTILLPRARM